MEKYKEKREDYAKRREEDEDDLKTRGIINRQTMVRDHRELRKTVLEAKLHNRL
jgi:hypothetical protein